MFLREPDDHNFADMEFLQSHHSANSSESPYTLGAGEFSLSLLILAA